ASGGQTEVFRVDVAAGLGENNHTTNVPLKPSDEVYVGETKRPGFARILPGWLRPVYSPPSGPLPHGRGGPLRPPRRPRRRCVGVAGVVQAGGRWPRWSRSH